MHDVSQWMAANKDLITSWTAILAILTSVTIAAINMTMQRRHNRKSVLPIGHVSVGDYNNQIFVRLWNYGVGPMIIKRVVVAREGEQKKPSIIGFMPKLPDDFPWSTFVGDISNRVIPGNDNIPLILLEGDEKNRDFVAVRQMVREILSGLTIKVEYKNVYGENMPPAVRNLDWFGRLLA
jgi:hypothetical protein